jgi:hypothetical protein
MELPTANFGIDHPIADIKAAEMALTEYKRVGPLVKEAIAEYTRHLSHDTTNEGNYRSHMDELKGDAALATADYDYLSAQMTTNAAERATLMASAKKNYMRSNYLFELLLLKYYTDTPRVAAALPPGFGRFHTVEHKGIDELSPQQADEVLGAVFAATKNSHVPDSHTEDQKDYLPYLARAGARLNQLRLASTQPTAAH